LHISVDTCTGSLIKQIFERPVDVEELMAADEVFCTGTAVVVNPVGSITYESRR
jgi:branched-chain amino acid aminotransferase